MLKVKAQPVDFEKAIAMAKGKAPDKPVVTLSKHGVRKIWDNYDVIDDIQVDYRTRIRIAIGTRDGYRYVSFREFRWVDRYGDWNPTKNGFMIPMQAPFHTEDSIVPVIRNTGDDFYDAYTRAMEAVRDMPLSDPDKSMYILTHYNRKTAVTAREVESNENQ